MSSPSEDEGSVHPVVSSLLGQNFVPRVGDFKYDRDEMVRIRGLAFSQTRPDYLSTDFNGDSGLFSPFKWLEYRWEVEGIKNRAPSKKLQDALRAEGDETAGLSPQRRGFAGGCRAPEDKKDHKDKEGSSEGWSTVNSGHEKERERLGSTGGNKWRSGASGGADKSHGKSSTDFKLPFQKKGSEEKNVSRSGGTAWRSSEGGTAGKQTYTNGARTGGRGERGGYQREERIPEWAKDTTTMDDMIELVGMDEPKKNKRGNKKEKVVQQEDTSNRSKKSEKDNKENRTSAENSRPLSRDATAAASSMTQNADSVVPRGNVGNLNAVLPNSDAEFAALLGLIDSDTKTMLEKHSSFPNDAATVPSGSRMSRFFSSNKPEAQAAVASEGSSQFASRDPRGAQRIQREDAQAPTSSPLLARIFAQTPGSGGDSPLPPGVGREGDRGGGMAMRLEDLERGLGGGHPAPPGQPQRLEEIERAMTAAQAPRPVPSDDRSTPEHFARGNPLQDPMQQAHLLQKLQKIAKHQSDLSEGERGNSPPQPGAPPQLHPSQRAGNINLTRDPHVSAQIQAEIQREFAIAMTQYQQGNSGNVPPPQMQEALRMHVAYNVVRHHEAMVVLQQQQQHQQQQQLRAAAAVAAAAAVQQQQQQQQQQQKTRVTTMIPASVQRQMGKAQAAQHERVRESSPNTNEAEGVGLPANAEVLKKMHMQQQYAVMMQAMQKGLPMGSWRNSSPAPTPQQLMTMQHNERLRQQLQQTAMLQKMMHEQQQQQQLRNHQQQMAMGSGGEGRSQSPFQAAAGAPAGPSMPQQSQQNFELSQVGPMQSPLEKILAAAGVHASQHNGPPQQQNRSAGSALPPSARPMTLEDLERTLTGQAK